MTNNYFMANNLDRVPILYSKPEKTNREKRQPTFISNNSVALLYHHPTVWLKNKMLCFLL